MKTAPQTRTVQTEQGSILYFLTRKEVKNINLRVKADGTVALSASKSVSARQADSFVRSKAEWIKQARQRLAKQRQIVNIDLALRNGGTMVLLGKRFIVKVIENYKPSVSTDDKTLLIFVDDPSDDKKIKREFFKWQQTVCRELFEKIATEVYPPFECRGIPFPQIKIRAMKSRWGSCHISKQVITLNSSLLFAPRSCIEYVVLHEFCHFVHPNHSKDFYHLVEGLLPDWKARKALLKETSIL